jgi:hypothetical protein
MPMLNSLQVTAIKVKLNGLETIIEDFYQGTIKPFIENAFFNLIELSKSKKFLFKADKRTDWISRLITSDGRKLVSHIENNK